MTIQYKLPKTSRGLKTIVSDAIVSASTMKAKVQIAAIAILYHAAQSGDYSEATRLLQGLGKGVREAALIKFFEVYGGLKVVGKEDEKHFKGWNGKEHIKENFSEAKANMWYEMVGDEKPVAKYDADKELLRVVRRLEERKKQLASGELTEEQVANIDLDISKATMNQLLSLIDVDSFGIIRQEEELDKQEAA